MDTNLYWVKGLIFIVITTIISISLDLIKTKYSPDTAPKLVKHQREKYLDVFPIIRE